MPTITNYDNVSLYTPDGKVKPLSYVLRSVELGTITLAITNNKLGIIIAYLGPKSKNMVPIQKIYKINKNTLFTFAGITNDGLEIVNYLHEQSLKENILKDRFIDPIYVFDNLSARAGLRTLYGADRMFGVGGLLLTYNNGVRVVQFEPTGNVLEVKAMSIGNRSQAARTILENNIENIDQMDINEMVQFGLTALRNAHADNETITDETVEIWMLNGDNEVQKLDNSEFFK